MEKVNIPFSMCKKFLTNTGMRASPEAVKKFEECVRQFSESLALTVSNNTKNRKKQTVQEEDFNYISADVPTNEEEPVEIEA